MNSQAPVITIDGPSGSGKGTVAGLLARELGWRLLDSGALYRLLAFNASNHGVDLTNEELLKALAAHLDVQFIAAEPGKLHQIILEGEDVSPTVRLLGILDIANGITPRFAPEAVLFPNIDLTAHLFAQPTGEWLGFDTTVAYGVSGLGATHTVLHDENGVIGTAVQGLTVRPRPA